MENKLQTFKMQGPLQNLMKGLLYNQSKRLLWSERVTLSYDMVGSQDMDMIGQKPPIILLHGMTSAKETWKNVIRPIAVATGRKAYAYDARNHGDSGWSDEINYEILQEDLNDFMENLHIKQAVLIGHSMGGKSAMLFATKKPDKIEKLIIEDISPKPGSQQLRNQAKVYVNLLEQAVKQIPPKITDLEDAKKFVNKILQDKVPEESRSSRHGSDNGSALPLCKDKDGKFRWKTNLKAILEAFLNERNSTNITGKYTGPTLVLYGTKSPYKVSADRDFIRTIFPSAQFRAIEGATHQLHLEYKDIFLNEIVDFINDS